MISLIVENIIYLTHNNKLFLLVFKYLYYNKTKKNNEIAIIYYIGIY